MTGLLVRQNIINHRVTFICQNFFLVLSIELKKGTLFVQLKTFEKLLTKNEIIWLHNASHYIAERNQRTSCLLFIRNLCLGYALIR